MVPIIDNIYDPEFVPWRPQSLSSSATHLQEQFFISFPASFPLTRRAPVPIRSGSIGILSRWIPSILTPPTQEPTSAEASRDLYYLMRLTQLITEKRNNALNYGKILLDDDEWSTDAPTPQRTDDNKVYDKDN